MSKSAYFLLISVALLFILGLLMVFDTTSAEALDKSLGSHTHKAFFKQLLFGTFGLSLAFWVWSKEYQVFIEKSWLYYLLICTALLCIFLPSIGIEINGAKRWIGYRAFSFQPSEFLKVLLPPFYLYLRRKIKIHTWKQFLLILLPLLIPIGFVFFQPDNGTVAILLVVLMMLFFISGVRWKYWALPIFIFSLLGLGAASRMKHVHDRIKVYLNPESDLLGKGHQPYQAKIAAGSGRLLGRGAGHSLQKLNYLPEARSDYIAAIYAEEFGFIGILFLILLYMVIACMGFLIAIQTNKKEGFYLASMCTFLISFQAFLNLGIVSGMLPSKGTNLPFFSQGGSSLLANTLAIAIVLNIAKQTNAVIQKDEKKKNQKKRKTFALTLLSGRHWRTSFSSSKNRKTSKVAPSKH